MDSHKTIGRGLALALAGLAAGFILRLVQMLFFFDYDTGFPTDGGLTAWAGLLAPLALAGAAGALFCGKDRRYGAYNPGQDLLTGVLGVLSGLLLLFTGLRMAADYAVFLDTGLSRYDSVQQGLIHVFFMLMCLAFGLVQMIAAAGLLMGRNIFAKAPLLYMAGVLWGISNLIMVYVFYAKSPSFIENFFSVIGAAVLLFSLLYICKLLAGVDEPGAAKRLFVSGGFVTVLELAYLLGNILLFLLGRTYFGEMPVEYQSAGAGAALFVLGFMLFLYRGSAPNWKEEPTEAERKAQKEASKEEAPGEE